MPLDLFGDRHRNEKNGLLRVVFDGGGIGFRYEHYLHFSYWSWKKTLWRSISAFNSCSVGR